jgi:hypothetical protein
MDECSCLVWIVGLILLFVLCIVFMAIFSHFSPPQYVTIPVHS